MNLAYDLIFILIAFVPTIVLNGFVQPFQRGFNCDDDSIRKPQVEHQSVPPSYLAVLITIPPFLCICFVHLFLHLQRSSAERNTLDRLLSLVLKDTLLYLFGLGLTNSAVDVAKFTIGRLRPNFYSVCQPRVFSLSKEIVECTNLPSDERLDSYFDKYVCGRVYSKDSHLSFMSGHAACSAYAMFFMAFYLQQVTSKVNVTRQFVYARALIQVWLVNLASFVAYTRVSDYMHHPFDVVIGFATGTLFAILTLFVVAKRPKSGKDQRSHNNPVSYRAQNLENVVYSF